MRSLSMLLSCCGLIVGTALAGETAAPPAFAKRPTANQAGDKVKIEFAVDRETDVSIFIEDAGGTVVRHLVAGVLGKNPPAPLKPGVVQSMEWDGKADYGKPAGPGPFKVRVALGLGARYDKVVIADPMSIGNVLGLATVGDGTLYVVAGAGAGVPNWSAQRLVALNRDGTFQRTLIPPPSIAAREQIEALGGVPVEVGGRTVPMVVNIPQRQNTAFWSSDQAAMTPDGKFLVLHPDARIGLVDVTGAKAPPSFLGPKLLPKVPEASFHTVDHRQYLAVSGDGKYAYLSGIAPKRSYSSEKTRPWSAVYRVTLPDRSPAEPFFGDPDKTGSDEAHLGGIAHGMAADGHGRLLICDSANKRVVVVSEADGKFVSSFPANNAEFVAADPRSGAVYLLKLAKGGTADVVKLDGWKDPKPLALIHLTAPRDYLQWRFAVDAGAAPVVLWASNGWQLFRIEDLGERFSDARLIGGRDIGDGGFVNLTVDRYRDDPEIYWRAGRPYWWARYNEKTGQTEALKHMEFFSDAAGACLEVGPDGTLYTQAWPQFLHKWDHSGKPLKWDTPFALPAGVKPYVAVEKVGNAIFMPVCMVFMTHTLGIRSDGHLLAFERKPTAPARHRKALFEYDPSGRRVGGPILWEASDAVIGPRFDQQGNIYVAEQVRPTDQLVPPEFAAAVGPVTAKSRWGQQDPKAIPAYYGSILKFTPKGGMIAYQRGHYAWDNTTQAYDGQPRLDPSLKTVDAACFAAGSSEFTFMGVKVTGAEWMHLGISQIFLGGCNCENTRFDVDPFGRVWYPDLARYRVGVLDTNGNPITTFGSYGNADNCGPESKDKRLAEPEIAFAWLIGVGVTDRYAYMGDSLNRRLLRAKLIYAAEETCDVK